MVKLIIKYLLSGIAGGCFLFVANLILVDLTGSEQLQNIFDTPTTYALGFIVIGIGLFGGAIVYEIERIGFVLKLVIHMVLGISLILLAGFYVGLYTLENQENMLFNIAINALILVAVWVACYFRDKRKVDRINQKILERNMRKPLDTE